MRMDYAKRILIIGSAGAGKSTLAKALSAALNLPIIHLDRYYWKPNWVATPNEEWDGQVRLFSAQEQWIMDGNYSRTLGVRMERADAVIFLDMPRLLCIYQALKRRVQYHGRTRDDLNEECPESISWEFIRWIWNFPKRSRGSLMQKLDVAKDRKQIITLKSRREVHQFVRGLERDNRGSVES